MRATLDCTSGWYAQQDWTGVPVRSLLRGTGQARSLLVHSAAGYWIRLPVSDVGRLLLATQVAGAPLSAGHGVPAAAGRAPAARVLVGEVGRPDRTPDDTLVVAAALPGDLTRGLRHTCRRSASRYGVAGCLPDREGNQPR